MTGASFPEIMTAVVIGLAVAAAVARLLLRRRSAPSDRRTRPRRMGVLVGLNVAAGVLLHLTLFPPGSPMRMGELIVVAGGASGAIARDPADTLVALPEAGAVAGAVRTPDLATALRRFPEAASLRIEGAGLTPRDQLPLPLPTTYAAPPAPQGLIELALPGPVAPGGRFSVGGQLGRLPGGTVTLSDPAGRVVDRHVLTAGGRFALTASAREAGLALFTLRLQDLAGQVLEQIAVPVEARDQPPPRVLVLAGAPDAETKFLRRWAEAARIDLKMQIDLGGGVQVGDAPGALTAASLSDLDLLVVDDRRWDTLSPAARAAITSALDAGLGLLLRPTGPLPATTRREWAVLGFPLSGGDDASPLDLPATPVEPANDPARAAAETPQLARRNFSLQGERGISLLRAADGTDLASWRPRGQGRIGVWTVADSYALVLSGRADRHGELWSTLFSTLARPEPGSPLMIEGFARQGSRLALCRADEGLTVFDPNGGDHALRVDPATGEQACAAYWPALNGWHVARDRAGRETPFFVHPANAAPSLRAFADREATLALAATAGRRQGATVSDRPGSPWLWFAGLLAALALLWWFERARAPSATDPS